MGKEKLNETVNSLFQGMEGFLTSKTVVGEPIYIKDTIILPLVDVSFGMGAGAFEAEKKEPQRRRNRRQADTKRSSCDPGRADETRQCKESGNNRKAS